MVETLEPFENCEITETHDSSENRIRFNIKYLNGERTNVSRARYNMCIKHKRFLSPNNVKYIKKI